MNNEDLNEGGCMELVIACADDVNRFEPIVGEVRSDGGAIDVGKLAAYYPVIQARMMEIEEASKFIAKDDCVVC